MAVFFLDLPLSTQLIIFLVASITSLFTLRSYLRSIFLGKDTEQPDSVTLNSSPSTGIVTEDIIPPAEGKIKYAGSFWRAVSSQQIKAGTVVEIIEQEDLLVTVIPAQQKGEE